MSWAGHVVRTENHINRTGFGVGKEIATLEIKDSDGTIILKCALNEQNVRAWIGVIWLIIGTGDGLL